MKKCVSLENGNNLECFNKHSNPQQFFVLFDKNLKGKEMIRCKNCINVQKEINVKKFDQVFQQIQQQMDFQYESLQANVNQKWKDVEIFSHRISKLKSSIMQKFDSILNLINEWKNILRKYVEEKSQYSIYQALENCYLDDCNIKKNFKQDLRNISIMDEGILNKIDNCYQQIKDLLEANNDINELQVTICQGRDKNSSSYQKYDHKPLESILYSQVNLIQQVQCKQIQDVQQRELCYALALNETQTLMASGFSNDVKIWQFNKGQLINTQISLKGESEMDIITCLTFSRRNNNLICGSYTGSINYWKEIDQLSWKKKSSQIRHKGLITSLILTKQEDQIITSSVDSKIIVWNVDQDGQISSSYILGYHQKAVFSVSINESEKQLVSSSLDKQLVIWEKTQDNKYAFKYVIQKSVADFGHRVTFINDNFIVWQQNQQSISHVFQQENGQFIEKPELKIELNNIENEDGQYLFPNIYNSQKQILIQKFHNSIFIIKHQKSLQFKLETQIDCPSNAVYGSLSKDGKYLVLWNFQLLQFSIYELQYN